MRRIEFGEFLPGKYIPGDQVFEATLPSLLGLASAISEVYNRAGKESGKALTGIHDLNDRLEEDVPASYVPGVIDIIRSQVRRLNLSALERRGVKTTSYP